MKSYYFLVDGAFLICWAKIWSQILDEGHSRPDMCLLKGLENVPRWTLTKDWKILVIPMRNFALESEEIMKKFWRSSKMKYVPSWVKNLPKWKVTWNLKKLVIPNVKFCPEIERNNKKFWRSSKMKYVPSHLKGSKIWQNENWRKIWKC